MYNIIAIIYTIYKNIAITSATVYLRNDEI